MGAGPSGGSLTIDAGSKLYAHREKLGVGSSLLIVWCCARDGIYGESVCLPFLAMLMWVFTQCAGVTHLVSVFLSELIAPCVNVDSVYPRKEVSSGGSYVTILNQDY